MLMTSVLCRAHSVLHSINIENVPDYRVRLLLYVLNGNLINKRHIFMSTLSKSPLSPHIRRFNIIWKVIWFNLLIVNHRFLRCSFFNFFFITRSLDEFFMNEKSSYTRPQSHQLIQLLKATECHRELNTRRLIEK